MKQFFLIMGAVYGLLSVVFGALGSHKLSKILTEDQLNSFDIAVRYQIYHAIVLLVIGFSFNFITITEKTMGMMYVLGVFLFSFSIYLLVFSEQLGINKSVIGPITPIGGFFMIIGWVLLIVNIVKNVS